MAAVKGSRGALRDGSVAAEFRACVQEKLSQETLPRAQLTPRPPANWAAAALGQRHPGSAWLQLRVQGSGHPVEGRALPPPPGK